MSEEVEDKKPEPAKSENDAAYGCLGIVAIVAVVWFLFAACSGGSSSSSGKTTVSVSQHLINMGVPSSIANSSYAPTLMNNLCEGLDLGKSEYDLIRIGQQAGISADNSAKIIAVAMVRNCPQHLP